MMWLGMIRKNFMVHVGRNWLVAVVASGRSCGGQCGQWRDGEGQSDFLQKFFWGSVRRTHRELGMVWFVKNEDNFAVHPWAFW